MMDREYELFRGGVLTKIKIKDHPYDTVEFTITKRLDDEETGKKIVDSGYTMFFDPREFREFFTPIINDMKVRFDNERNENQS